MNTIHSLLLASLVVAAGLAPTRQDEARDPQVPAHTPPAAGAAGAAGSAEEPAEPTDCEARLTRQKALLEQERRAWKAERVKLVAEYESQIAALRRELEQEVEKRIRREEEWLQYTRALSVLQLSEQPHTVVAPPEAIGQVAEAGAERDAVKERSEHVARSLRALLLTEQVDGLELLEAGRLDEGWIGPVVFRLLDDRGRPAGTLCAERLRLRGSRAGRTLTLVFEEGYERRGGRIFPFETLGADAPSAEEAAGFEVPVDESALLAMRRGERRFVLPLVDPEPWVQEMPEVFDQESVRSVRDDGAFNLPLLTVRMNERLGIDSSGGYWRVRHVGGVVGKILQDVQVDRLDPDGRLVSVLFADFLSVVPQDRGIMLLLEAGVQVRGDRKAPFLDGRYRIFLPRAEVETWRAAGVPMIGPGSDEETTAPATEESTAGVDPAGALGR